MTKNLKKIYNNGIIKVVMGKKIAIIFLIVVGIIATITYMYMNQLNNARIAKRENSKFEFYQNEVINGENLATIINKAIDSNIKNEIQKNNKGKFIEDENNSINIDIIFLDSKNTINMEAISNKGIDKFLIYYKESKFKCMDVQYHKNNSKIKYMLFEQITQ